MTPLALLRHVTHRIDATLNALTCRVAGHQPDWPLAVALGITDRPVCHVCRRPLP